MERVSHGNQPSHIPMKAFLRLLTEVSKAEIEFNRVEKVEDQFHKDFDGLDST